MDKLTSFVKRRKYWAGGLIILLAGIMFFVSRGTEEVAAESLSVVRTTVSEEVSITGRIVPAQEVDLGVQTGGRIKSINAQVGQKVKPGQVLLTVEASDLHIRLQKQQAALEKAKISFSQQEPNTGDAESDLRKAYEDGFNTIANAFLDLPSMVNEIEDMLYSPSHSSYLANDQRVRSIAGNSGLDYKSAVGVKFDRLKERFASNLRSYNASNRESDESVIESLIDETYETTREFADVIKDVRNLVDYLENKSNMPATSEMEADQETLNTYTEETNSHLLSLLAIRNTIKDSRDSIVVETGDIESGRIDILQAELDIEETRVQISNRTIISPISGTVTAVEAGVGETISQGSPVISIISSGEYEIEASIPEADLSKVKVGADVEVELDAYGSDAVFTAKVISINPSATMVDGVATYEARFYLDASDERILSGMTANLTIFGKKLENVIAVPQRSVITKNGKKHIRVIEAGVIVEREVQTGLRGSDGNVEIISGLSEGDRVVIFSE